MRRFLKHHGIHCPCFPERLQVKKEGSNDSMSKKTLLFRGSCLPTVGKASSREGGVPFFICMGG